jgi:hypothetical protein
MSSFLAVELTLNVWIQIRSGRVDSDLTELRNSGGATMSARTLSLQERIFQLQEEVKRVSERNAAMQQIEQKLEAIFSTCCTCS